MIVDPDSLILYVRPLWVDVISVVVCCAVRGVICTASHRAVSCEDRGLPRLLIGRLVRLAVAVVAKLAHVTDREVGFPRICGALLYYRADVVGEPGVLHPVQHNVSYSGLSDKGFAPCLKVDSCSQTNQSSIKHFSSDALSF